MGVSDTSFVLIAVSSGNGILRGNLNSTGLKQLVEDLGEVAVEVACRPADDEPLH